MVKYTYSKISKRPYMGVVRQQAWSQLALIFQVGAEIPA